MICVHPSVTHSKASLALLQITTGLKVTLGQSYLRLVNQDGSTPPCKPAPAKRAHAPTFRPGGNAA